MSNLHFELRELFHLEILRHLALRLSGRGYAVKGGICLRFFHLSPRLSEDMDLDVTTHVQRETLERGVDTILGARPFLANLAAAGIRSVRFSKPKQTATVQRWKVGLLLSSDVELHTKLEFSRRQGKLSFEVGQPAGAILDRYQIPRFAAQYYGASAMCAQKIRALAAASRNAVRDLFDLHYLIEKLNAGRCELKEKPGKEDVKRAIEKVRSYSRKDFDEQVLPYLTPELMAYYEQPPTYRRLQGEVEQKLVEWL
jgi:predicted nucleotidyltransferase component of viral defense system